MRYAALVLSEDKDVYYRTDPTPRLRSRNLDTPAPVSLRALLDFLRKASGRSIVFVADRSCRSARGQGVGQQFLTKYHFAACVDCGLNVQLRTPSLRPNRGRARTLEVTATAMGILSSGLRA